MKHSPEVIKTEIWKSDSECKEVCYMLSDTGRNGVLKTASFICSI